MLFGLLWFSEASLSLHCPYNHAAAESKAKHSTGALENKAST